MTLSRNLGGFGSTANASGLVATTALTGTISASQLASTAVTPATYGGDNVNHRITVDQQGRITSAANVAMPQIQAKVFTAWQGTASISGGTLTTATGYGIWPGMNNITPPSTAATATNSGTTLNVSAISAGCLGPGNVVTFPGLVGTYTNSGTTMTVATATSGALGVGSTFTQAAAFTAAKTTTVMNVTAISSGAIYVGMVTNNCGTVTSLGTGTGGIGTYNMTLNSTVGTGAKTGTGTVTVTALGTGIGGVGTYTIDKSYTLTPAAAITATNNAATRTISALGTGVGGVGTYTLSSAIDAASTMAITSSSGLQTFTCTAINADATSCTVTNSNGVTFSVSGTMTGNAGTWTAPAGTTQVKAYVFGGSGGGVGGQTSCDQSGAGGSAGAGIGIYTVSPGTSYSITVGTGGNSALFATATSGTSSSFSSFLTATGGTAATVNGSSGQVGADGVSSGGTLRSGVSSRYVIFPGTTAVGFMTSTGSTYVALYGAGTFFWNQNSTIGPGAGQDSPQPSGMSGMIKGISGAVLLEYVGQ
jgi:hypothetical protein